ncbi:MAG: TetR/AcrR family transcriptional regulator [Anaerolineae bacterium]|nr:TetR/AcrR family transcriptional regulator [Anaerolineae bacterium]
MSPQQRSRETRERILAAAQSCFSQHGYDATGVAEICRRAGVSKGAFYHHFPSKQALFLELFDRWLAGLDAQLLALQEAAPSVPEGLVAMAEMAERLFQQARGQLPLFLEFWTKAVHDPVVWRTLIAPYRRYREFFAQMVRRGIEEGSLKPVDPEAAALAIVSMAVGLFLQRVLESDDHDLGSTMRASFLLLVQGLERKG